MRVFKMTLSGIALAVLAGCASAPNIDQAQQTSQSFSNALSTHVLLSEVAKQSEQNWWQQLNIAELDQFVVDVLDKNQNLKASSARLRAALAGLSVQQRANLPQGGLAVSGNRSNLPSSTNPNADVVSSATAGGNVHWQLDLSGRIAALTSAAEAVAVDSQAQYQQLLTELVSTSVRSFLQWQNLQQQQALTLNQLKALEDSMEIIQVRIEEGIATELELNRTRVQYYELKQRLPQIGVELAQVEQTLSALTDKRADELSFTVLSQTDYDALNLTVNVQSADDALMQRGDIRSAMAKVHQQGYLAQSAERALYPDISLSAFAGVLNIPGMNFNNTQSNWQVTPSINWSLFSYPQLLAQLDAQTALSEASYHSYKQTLTDALSQTELSLRALQHAQQQFALSTKTVKAARAAYQQAEAGYQEGQLAYLDLLAARQDVLSAERSQVLIRNQWLSASVAAYSQLSGGWSSQLISNL